MRGQFDRAIFLSGSHGFVGSHLLGCTPIERMGLDWVVPKGPCDYIIHLAGANIARKRWTSDYKRIIYESRVLGTQNLVKQLLERNQLPKVFISASAVGFYGDRGDELLTETSCKGKGFLAEVCADWEKATEPLSQSGVRVCHARFGMVLGKGGALERMRWPFLLGLGGRLGSGNQYVSWIHIDDLVAAMQFVLEHEALSGPINFVAPHPVRNQEMTERLAASVHRWVGPPLPPLLLKILVGEMAEDVLLASQQTVPEKLLQAGFSFSKLDFPGFSN